MKFLKSFQLFEFNRKDRQLLLSSGINDNFTVSFEFELECDDPKIAENISDRETLNQFRFELIEILKDKINIGEYAKFIDDTINGIDFDDDEEDILKFLMPKKSTPKMSERKRTEQLILGYLYDIVSEYFENVDEEDEDIDDVELRDFEYEGIEYLEDKVKESFPQFYQKYGDDCKYELDGSLRKGIEFSLKTYLTSLTDGIEMLEIFFTEYEKQTYFFMNENTSIHINLGLIDKDVEYNVLKGVVMTADTGSDVPFVYKDMTWRMNNRFCGSIIDELKAMRTNWNQLDLHDVKATEEFFVEKIKELFLAYGPKAFGVNLDRLFNNGYVEFRYAGGRLNKDLMIDKLMYFAYIIYCMTTDYKQREYTKKLYKFVEDLKS